MRLIVTIRMSWVKSIEKLTKGRRAFIRDQRVITKIRFVKGKYFHQNFYISSTVHFLLFPFRALLIKIFTVDFA